MKNLSFIMIACMLAVPASADWEKDKKLHFAASTGIGLASGALIEDWKLSTSVCLGVGLAKEVYDEIDYGGFDEKDMLANAGGCVTGLIIREITGLNIAVTPSDGLNGVDINFGWRF
ncbi:hypothetical protein [Vibrio alginolyticus]|uniref:hypothetical protein n=1 Tax=Vibrio alginolyticus TaxID=663 RepID=UPI001E568178|nr:hypothetical protein [Vibrio alginolyticus]